ncbi:hypothetical protein Ancab_001842 [Ancistrocladus abbreviatus]
MKGQEPIIHPQTTNNNIPFQYHLKPVDQVLYCESNPQVAAMASEIRQCSRKKEGNRGAWSSEEDKRLVEAVEIHGPRRWKAIAYKAGLKRCGKSCRLRWMNYLRPNIKRGNISDQEEDLILRLHKLLGNRSVIPLLLGCQRIFTLAFLLQFQIEAHFTFAENRFSTVVCCTSNKTN